MSDTQRAAVFKALRHANALIGNLHDALQTKSGAIFRVFEDGARQNAEAIVKLLKETGTPT